MKHLLLLSLVTSSMFGMELALVKPSDQKVNFADTKNKMHISPFSVSAPSKLGDLDLYHGKKGFYIRHDDKKHIVQKYFTDKMVRNMDKKQLQAFLVTGKLAINQMDDGEYSLKAKLPLNGGGVFGASVGAFLGKAAVYVVGHGAIQIVALCTGPAYPVTLLALEGCFAVSIEAASMAGAVAGGIALGVATGPV